jgi:hypothetical protein
LMSGKVGINRLSLTKTAQDMLGWVRIYMG